MGWRQDGARGGHLAAGSAGCLDVGQVLGGLDEAVEVVGIDDGRDPLPASREIDGVVAHPCLVDDIGKSRAGVADGEFGHDTMVRRKR